MEEVAVAAAAFIYQELLESDNSSSSEDEYNVRGPLQLRPRIQNYIINVVDQFSEEEFRENFRMYRPTFDHILMLIKEDIASGAVDNGRHTISAKEQLLVALWYFATPDSFRSICSRFNIGKATGIRTVRRVANALFKLAPTIIKWPSVDEMDAVINGFQQMGFPNTVGVIDGSYIPIPVPSRYGASYINRKSFAALILQGVCDHKLKFIHCYAGEAGACHDARVLKKSEVWTYINERVDDMFPNDTHLLGDKAYPCVPQLMTPYKNNGHLTVQQTNFNFLLSSARSTIERAFGLLKKRFRCLKFLDVRCLNWAPVYIIACCVLHNICIMRNDIFDVEDLEINEEENDEGHEHDIDNDQAFREKLYLGRLKRNRLSEQLFNLI